MSLFEKYKTLIELYGNMKSLWAGQNDNCVSMTDFLHRKTCLFYRWMCKIETDSFYCFSCLAELLG
jgi:hypothetical protein